MLRVRILKLSHSGNDATFTIRVTNTLTYNIVVTNTGNVTLTNVTVADSAATLGVCSPLNGSDLAPLATMTCAASAPGDAAGHGCWQLHEHGSGDG